jgi:hypothetical protein
MQTNQHVFACTLTLTSGVQGYSRELLDGLARANNATLVLCYTQPATLWYSVCSCELLTHVQSVHMPSTKSANVTK